VVESLLALDVDVEITPAAEDESLDAELAAEAVVDPTEADVPVLAVVVAVFVVVVPVLVVVVPV